MSKLLTTCDHIAIDTETTGVDPTAGNAKIVAFGLYDPKGNSFWLPPSASSVAKIKALMEAKSVAKIGHNLKFDLMMMHFAGIRTWSGDLHDTLLMAHLLEPDVPKDLESLCRRHLNDPCREKEELARWLDQADWRATQQIRKLRRYAKRAAAAGDHELLVAIQEASVELERYQQELAVGYGHVPPAMLERYGRLDPQRTMRLFYLMKDEIERRCPETYEIERRLLPHIARMQIRGVPIDAAYCRRKAAEIEGRLEKLRAELSQALKLQDFNPSSREQVIHVLKRLGLPLKTDPDDSEHVDTGEEALTEYDHPLVQKILLYRVLSKLRSTYFQGLEARLAPDGTIHTSYNQAGTRTGRFSSSNPNLQNIPSEGAARVTTAEYQTLERGVKRAFLVRSGCENWHFDYKQIELRLFVHFSNDAKAREFLLSGRDFHSEVCRVMFGKVEDKLRLMAKVVVFGTLYGASEKMLMERFKMSQAMVRRLMQDYYQAFPSVRSFQARTASQVLAYGYVTTLSGRRIPISRQEAYKGVNARIQGSAADLLKRAMVCIGDRLRRERRQSEMLMTIHDEIVVGVHQTERRTVPATVVTIMQEQGVHYGLTLPLTVDAEATSTNWGDLKKTEVPSG